MRKTIIDGHKKCSKCKETLPVESFHPRPDRIGFVRARCIKCWKGDSIGWTVKHRERNRASLLRLRYGITVAEYEDLLKKQEGKCAICRSDNPNRSRDQHFHVDHDHDTGAIRGLLCVRCNLGIGCFGDGAIIHEAAAYMRKHKSEEPS